MEVQDTMSQTEIGMVLLVLQFTSEVRAAGHCGQTGMTARNLYLLQVHPGSMTPKPSLLLSLLEVAMCLPTVNAAQVISLAISQSEIFSWAES